MDGRRGPVQTNFHPAEFSEHHVYTEDGVLMDQQLWNQDRNCSLDPEELEPQQIKEEQEEPDLPQIKKEQEDPDLEISRRTTVKLTRIVPAMASASSQAPKLKKKRAKKTAFSLDAEEEKSMLEFLQEFPMLWDIKRTDYRRKEKKNKLWEDQGERMGKPAYYLRGWFKSLRDNYTRLSKRKREHVAPNPTEREQWVMDNFSFMKAVTRHRPVYTVKTAPAAQPSNLVAAEAALEELADADDRTSSPTCSTSTVHRDTRAQEEDLLQSLRKGMHQSWERLKCLRQPQSISERTVFANYVCDSLLTMNKRKFRKARSAISKVLSQVLDEDSEDDPQTLPSVPHDMPPPARPISAQADCSSSLSEMYQPPPSMWRHGAPQASVWASATPEYMQ
ncbi:uncharacterized protein LOC106521510 isoform X2 [Austrofundulus limnaeus]|uniref:Uncharacterized protein LOC106521510 isoform X2 n=1 Tax=Austrofundulus limnaeus TaxID=52670 RepID=A0A2I4BPB3_AUSLI|nr:PREDICTED: uncharacterized protein LOC106521510 isoform X2 [Austrofundulus limnaeus]